jgi:4-carboxymuconolactone decarboxylase
MNERYEKGTKQLLKYASKEQVEQMHSNDQLADIAPHLRKYIMEFAYGDIYSRGVLADRERQLIVIASLVTQGVEQQLTTHIKRGLYIGLTLEEIVEAITQLIPYIGFPKVQNALLTLQQIKNTNDF